MLAVGDRESASADFTDSGKLQLNCTGPLVLYALRELGVNPHHAEAEPRAQQIEIANRDAVTPWVLWS